MTYFGTTAGTTAANPPLEIFCGVGGKVQYPGDLTTAPKGSKVWLYSSTNIPSDVKTAGFFTDGAQLGMWPGDIMFCVFNGGAYSAGVAGTTNMYAFVGILNSTESSLSTGAYNLSSLYST